MHRISGISAICLAALALSACDRKAAEPAHTSETEASAEAVTVWPSTLRVLGDGYPRQGNACRRLGETAATVNLLDDSAILVGCPGGATDDAAAAIVANGGRAVGTEQNITMLSIPQGDTNIGMPLATNAGASQDSPRSSAK